MNCSDIEIMEMPDSEVYKLFALYRWPQGKPACPWCGSCYHYVYKKRQIYKCQSCNKQYSITTGTIFAGRKLQLRDILLAQCIFEELCTEIGAADFRVILESLMEKGISYKSAYVLWNKMFENDCHTLDVYQTSIYRGYWQGKSVQN